MSINRVVISGNLTRDPEVRTTASGMPIMSLGVAVNDRRKNQQTGEWEDYANFIDCTMFGSRAEALSRYLSKGQKVAVEGKLRWSQWEARDGSGKRSKVEVVIDNLEFMSSRNDGGQSGYSGGSSYAAPAASSAPAAASAAAAPASAPEQAAPYVDASSPVYDEDIPF